MRLCWADTSAKLSWESMTKRYVECGDEAIDDSDLGLCQRHYDEIVLGIEHPDPPAGECALPDQCGTTIVLGMIFECINCQERRLAVPADPAGCALGL